MIVTVWRGIGLLPTALRKPAVAGRWLVEAHRAQVALVLSGALMIFALPPLLGWALPRFYPPIQKSHRVLGIPVLSSSQPDPRAGQRAEQVMVLLWAAWLAAAGVMLLTALPNSVAGSRRRAHELAEQADALEPRDTEARIRLYRSALELMPDAGDEASLRERLRALGPAATTRSPVLTLVPRSGESSGANAPVAGTAAGCVGAGDRYRLTRELGRGGMGVVYSAWDSALQREVALKELPLHLSAKGELAQRFRQEARVLARLSHPCIVQVYDLIEDRGRLWISLELVRGGTMEDACRRSGGALAWQEMARLGAHMAEGLAFAHSQGVIHRDIKPINVLLTDGSPSVAKLTDFGLARMTESTQHTQPGSLMGSARYMSPEQCSGQPADARSDIYALGITFFEMLSGRVPFDGEVIAVIARHQTETPPHIGGMVPALPRHLAELVMSMLAKSPEDRPADADSIARALNALAA
jgi:hypothetical protein